MDVSFAAAADDVLTLDGFRARAKARLTLVAPPDVFDATRMAPRGDFVDAANGRMLTDLPVSATRARPAAVLVPVVARAGELHVILTQRAGGLRVHSGQIAFPGGKIDPGDASPMAAALREAQEEIGLDPRDVTPLGYLDAYHTGTGFRILPLVALVDAKAEFTLNAAEVESIFEPPLAFLMTPANHQRHARDIGGRTRHFYAMPWEERFIWGATAGILHNLYERLHA